MGKNNNELVKNIEDVMNRINDEFPELSKYILEMPVNDSNGHEVNLKNLEDYYVSLVKVIERYSKTHTKDIPEKEKGVSGDKGFLYYPYAEDTKLKDDDDQAK